MILLVSFSIIIPMSVGALCSAKLNINYNINVKYLDSLFCSAWETGDILIPYREGMTWQEFDDYIIDNYQDYNTYFYDRDGHLIKNGYLKKYGINENSKASRYDYEYAENVLPVNDRYNPDILQDDFFSFGKIKQRHINYYNYSYPNRFLPIADLESKYPEFYNKVSVDPNWLYYNQNIFDEKYGCYWFDGS